MTTRKRLAIFYHHPFCSIQSAHGIYNALHDDYTIDFVDNLDNVSKYQILAVPGGIGDSDSYHQILEHYKPNIQEFIKNNYYLGICMGAYWASKIYLDLTTVSVTQYIKAQNTEIRRSFGTTLNVRWNRKHYDMYFYDGCTFGNLHKQVKVIARYANDNPAAIIDTKNHLGLIGPHPESDRSWYKNHIADRYHHGDHHELLRKFVKKLTEDSLE